MNISERTIKGFIGLGAARLTQQTFTWVLSIAIARVLDPTDYGLMALGVFFTNLVAFVSEFGLSSALIQRQELEERDVNAAFWVMLAANLGIYALVWLAAQPIAAYYDTPALTAVIQVLALTFIISSVRLIPMCLLTRELQFERCGWAELGGGVASGVVMLWMALAGYGVWALVMGSLVNSLATTVLMLWYKPWLPKPVFEFARVRGMLRYGLSMNGSKMLSYLSGNADNLIVGKVIGGQALGLYNMAFILGTMPTQKVTPIIYRISFPVLSRLQGDEEASRQYFLSFSRYIGMCAAAAMFGLMIVADDFVLTVLGQKWAPMIFPLRLLCGVGVLKALAVMLNVVLSARDRTGTLLVYCIVELAVLSAAFLIGARWGIGGVALGWLAAYPLLFLYQLRAVLRELDLRLSTYLQTLKLELLASGAMVVAALAVRSTMPVPGLLRLGATAAAGGMAFVAVVLCDRSLRDRLLAVISRIGMTKARALAAEQASSSQV